MGHISHMRLRFDLFDLYDLFDHFDHYDRYKQTIRPGDQFLQGNIRKEDQRLWYGLEGIKNDLDR
jgi:hypothetical protein